MTKYDKLGITGLLIILIAVVFSGYGWIHNIVLLTRMELTPVTGKVIVRAVGIPIAPIGVVMGYVKNAPVEPARPN